MKKAVITLLCLCANMIVAHAQDGQTGTPATEVKPQPRLQFNPEAGKFRFEEETHDFGEVVDGPPVECDFEFRNVGKNPIIISEAHGSCGCTVPNWPKDPILPKHKAVIHVTYNTKGRVGPINKDVIITSNAQQNPMKLHLTGYVKPRPEEERKPVPPPPPPPPPEKNN